MDHLPYLPFEKVLSYLSLEDRIRARAVSRTWRNKIGNFEVSSLFFSSPPSGFIYGKSRLIGEAQNIISSSRFDSFFDTFRKSILSNLKHLRLCGLRFNTGSRGRRMFVQILNSFCRLEQLGLFRLELQCNCNEGIVIKLNLPALKSIHLEDVNGVAKLTLDAPTLQKARLCCSLRLELIHAASVERLIVEDANVIEAKQLRNLQYLYIDDTKFDSAFLSDLKQLKEIHLADCFSVLRIFEQKRRYARDDLKVFFCGCLLNGPGDPVTFHLNRFDLSRRENETFSYLAENPSRLADEVPFCRELLWSAIERLASGSEANVLNRYTDLDCIRVDRPVQDVQRFLAVLQKFGNIAELCFECDQSQDLYERLPEHCAALQKLTIQRVPLDSGFLSRFKDAIYLDARHFVDSQLIQTVLQELEFLSRFDFNYTDRRVKIRIDHLNRFEVWAYGKETIVSDPNAVVSFLKARLKKKRKFRYLLF